MPELRRILVVDDNPAIHEDFKKVLERPSADRELDMLEQRVLGKKKKNITTASPGFRIDSALQGQQALEMVRAAENASDPYDVVFLDMRMPPGWDGLETLEKIWAEYPETEVVICSAYSDYSWDDIAERFSEVSNLLVLKKPFEPIEIQQMALSLSRKRQLSRRLQFHLNNLEQEVRNKTVELEEQRAKSIFTSQMAALGEMAGGIAHEINTPLANVRLLVDHCNHLAKKGEVNPEMQITVSDQIITTLDRVQQIISSLRTLARDGASFPPQEAAIQEIIDINVNLCSEKLRVAKTQLRTSGLPTAEKITCRAVQIGQVIMNLINNSVDAIANLSEKWIEIGFKDRGDEVEISVTDSGNGIPVKLREKIFQPFFSTKELGKGSGLGLSISMSIVKSHGGQFMLDVDSPNTRFVIILPKQPAGK